jgi:hypothetical protein
LIAFGIALAYPINSLIHHEIRTAIEKRRNGEQAANPLAPAQGQA